MTRPAAELELARLAIDMGACEVGGTLSCDERALVREAELSAPTPPALVSAARKAVIDGDDPLGERFCRIRPASQRRELGAYFTGKSLLSPMLDWTLARRPARLVDAGCGSGRFAIAAARRQPSLQIVAVDIDALATLLTRAAFAALGAREVTILQCDYTRLDLARSLGPTAFVGNPPYVRHHDLSPEAKARGVEMGRSLGLRVSALAGLHAHFFLATALYSQPGDLGCFVTSAEWLDVNYGSVIRNLLCDGLGGQALHVIDPRAVPFEDAMTTAAIICFEVGAASTGLRLASVESPHQLRNLGAGRLVGYETLAREARWTPLVRGDVGGEKASGLVPLRALADVHRGAATGANDFFVLTRGRARFLGIEEWCKPAITSAKEILESGGVVHDGPERRVVLDIPRNLSRGDYPALDGYLRMGEQRNPGDRAISERYIPTHRRPWWHLGLSAPPPIVATYMARQAPVFALNPDGLALVNIAHGVYPRQKLEAGDLAALVHSLNASRQSFRGNGRTYHGGLEKFEPREMEALLVPAPGSATP